MTKEVGLPTFQVHLTFKAMLELLEAWFYSVEPRSPWTVEELTQRPSAGSTDHLQGLTQYLSAGRQGAFLVHGDLQCRDSRHRQRQAI